MSLQARNGTDVIQRAGLSGILVPQGTGLSGIGEIPIGQRRAHVLKNRRPRYDANRKAKSAFGRGNVKKYLEPNLAVAGERR